MKTSIFVLLFLFPLLALAEPPFVTTGSDNFSSTIKETDLTTFVDSVYLGMGERTILDRRFEEAITLDVYLFQANYSDGLAIEFEVNPEFGSAEASSTEVEFYAPIIGRLPFVLRRGLHIIWINAGKGAFTIGTGAILIHTEEAQGWANSNLLEEILAHEASHLSLDGLYYDSPEWLEAQIADGANISTYGRDKPAEDQTESFLAYLAIRYRADRLLPDVPKTVNETIPNRIAFYDSLHLNVEPLAEFKFLINAGLNDAWFNPVTAGQGFFISIYPGIKKVFLAWFTYDVERPPASVTALLGEPGHRWLTAFGDYVDDTAELVIELTQGGVFDQTNPKAVTENGYGTMTLEFADCREGLISYDIPSLGLSGEIPIRRIAEDNVELCEDLNEPLMSGLIR